MTDHPSSKFSLSKGWKNISTSLLLLSNYITYINPLFNYIFWTWRTWSSGHIVFKQKPSNLVDIHKYSFILKAHQNKLMYLACIPHVFTNDRETGSDIQSYWFQFLYWPLCFVLSLNRMGRRWNTERPVQVWQNTLAHTYT